MKTTAPAAALSHAHATDPASLPSYASIKAWGQVSGMSRSAIYRALGAGHLHAKKIGKSTRIDVADGLAWILSLPEAKFRAPRA